MAVKDMKNDELLDHYYELKHLNADDAETAKYYKELVREMAERFAIMVENESLNKKAESDIEVRKPCINYEDGCEEWAGCPCVHFKART